MNFNNKDYDIVQPIFENGFARKEGFPDALDLAIETEIKRAIYTPEFKNLIGIRIIYRERYITICTVEDMEITERDFTAKVRNYHTIYNGRFNQYRLRDSWDFGCVWWAIRQSTENQRISSLCIFSMWIDENFVQKIESLVLENRYDDALKEIYK